MDELQISGKRFISSRRIARENGYTSDYIGQLIRGGKIVGQKVGRAWYVDAASFESYLKGEEGAPAVAMAAAPEVVEAAPEIIEAAPEVMEEKEEEQAEILPTPEEVVAQAEEEEAEEEVEEEEIAAPVALQKEESVHIPLRIMQKEEEKKEVSGLRYVAEDAPSLPEIRSNKKESRIPYEVAMEEEESEALETALPVAVAAPAKRKAPIVALTLASVAIFVFCAVVSSALSLNLSIREGNSAATSYSFDW